MDLDLKRLQQVITVVRAGSISKAAEELHMTQPALSRSIATLEDRYGFRIFDRGRGGASLTPVGKSVVREAEELLRQARSVDHNFKLYQSGKAGQIAFGMGPLIASLLLPALSVHFLRERPHLQLQAVTRPASVLYEELLEDRIELLFCGGSQLQDKPQIHCHPVGHIQIANIVRSDHPLARQKATRLEDIAAFPLLIGAEVIGASWGRQTGAFICDNYHILRDTTLDTDGVWISSPDLVRQDIEEGRLQSLTLEDNNIQTLTEVYRVSRKSNQLSPSAIAVSDYVSEYLKRLPTT